MNRLAVAAAYAALVAVLLAPLPAHLGTMVAGDTGHTDWSQVWHVMWFVGSNLDQPLELSHTDLLRYPVGLNYAARVGNFVDLIVFGAFQNVFGTTIGYNLGVWLLLVVLGCTVHHCAMAFGGRGWLPLIAGSAVLSSPPVANEIGAGRFCHLTALAFSALFLAELPAVVRGRKSASIRAGVWLALTTLSYWFTGLLLIIVLALPATWAIFRRDAVERRRLLAALGIAAASCGVIVAGPMLYQATNLDAVPGLDGTLRGDLFGAEQHRRTHSLRLAVTHSGPPLELLASGVPQLSMLLLGLVSFRLRERGLGLWWWILAASVAVVWGPMLESTVSDDGGQITGVLLPYSVLFRTVPLMWRFVWLDRFALFTALAVAVLAVGGAVSLVKRTRLKTCRAQALVVLVGVGLVCAEGVIHGHLPMNVSTAPEFAAIEGLPAAVERMRTMSATADNGAVVAYPATRRLNRKALFYQTIHHRPMLNGHKGLGPDVMPPELVAMVYPNTLIEALGRAADEPGEAIVATDVARLESLGFSEILIHLDALDTRVNPFLDSSLGRLLTDALGPPEIDGCLLVYDLGKPEK